MNLFCLLCTGWLWNIFLFLLEIVCFSVFSVFVFYTRQLFFPFCISYLEYTVFLKKLYGPFLTVSRLEPFRGGSLLFTTKFPENPGTPGSWCFLVCKQTWYFLFFFNCFNPNCCFNCFSSFFLNCFSLNCRSLLLFDLNVLEWCQRNWIIFLYILKSNPSSF